MSEAKLISPLLDNFAIGGMISEHHGVRCYPAMKNNSDTRYIVKVISIPASQVQLQAFLLTGVYKSEEDAKAYFADLASGIQAEVDTLAKLASLEGFLAFEGCQVVEKEDEVGYDVYLLGTYKRSLERQFRKEPMTHIAAVNLGLDMCASLAVCRQSGFMYLDLKPGNIFISDDNEYRIGDLGFYAMNGLKYATLPDRYRNQYTAPELADAFAPISETADIFAAGMVLYQAYNGGVLPYEGNAPAEALPAPMYADYEMAEIIAKAIAVDPAERWSDPIKMGQAIVSYMQRNGANDTPIVPLPTLTDEIPIQREPEEFEEELPLTEEESQFLLEHSEEADQLSIEQILGQDAEETEETQEIEEIQETEEAEEDATNIAASVEEPVQEVAEEAEATEEASTEEPAPSEEDDIASLAFLDQMVSDETAPAEEMADDIIYSDLSDDANSILSIADDLIAHEAPAPAVAPEAIEIPMPEPIVLEEESTEDSEIVEAEDAEDEPPVDEVSEAVAAISEAVESPHSELESQIDTELQLNDNQEEAEEITEEATEETEATSEEGEEEEESPKASLGTKILTGILIAIIAACIGVAGFLFYRDYYIKTVDELVIKGFDNQLTVSVVTDADHSLLSVICTDTYGNKQIAPLLNGSATFADLSSDSLYKISLDISGFHGLKGQTKGTYTTAPQTEIVSFVSVTGAEAGSAILSFTVKGHDTDKWVITYSASGEQERTHAFSGHTTTITGLTVGKVYTMRLDTVEEAYVVGQSKLEHSASDLIYPEDLDVSSLTEEGMIVTWKAPEGASIPQWTVLCYNDTGFNQTLTTAETTAQFTGMDPKESYTVEVTAAGMSVGSRFYISKNSVTVSDLTATPEGKDLKVSWNLVSPMTDGNWVLTYRINDDPTEISVECSGTTAIIEDAVPETTYTLLLRLEDGTTVLSGSLEVDIAEAAKFKGYSVSADDMKLTMGVAPNKATWNWYEITKKTNTFTVGQKGGFILRLYRVYDIVNDPVTTLFVIRDEEGNLVSYKTYESTWKKLWNYYYGQLEIPAMPQEAGTYTIEVYFNGAIIHEQPFTIQ